MTVAESTGCPKNHDSCWIYRVSQESWQLMNIQGVPRIKTVAEYTGCPTNHDNWWIYRVSHESRQLVNIQGVPRIKTVAEQFWMSSSIYCIRCQRLFAVYLVKNPFYSNIFYFEIHFTIMKYFLLFSLASNNLTNYGKRQNYSPTFMFHGTPCTYAHWNLNNSLKLGHQCFRKPQL